MGVTRRSIRIIGMTNTDQVGMQQGQSTPATTTTQSSSQPWSAATPLLTDLISKYGSTNTDVTPGQSTALTNLTNAANSVPSFGADAASGVSKLFNSDTTGQIGMLNTGYDTLNKNIGGTASGAELDPYSTPGFSDAINTMSNDITNRVKGVYAGSGRDPSGAGSFAGSLGRGLTQGIAPVIQSQFNTNKTNQLGAANTLYNASGTTAGNITQQGQVPLTNILSGLQGAGMIPGITTAPAATALAAANTAQNQPFQNLSQLLTPALGFGALGTNSSGTSTQTPANNPLMNILGGATAATGLLFSDRRLKEGERTEAILPSGLPVKSFSMKHDPFKQRQIGLIAQDVEKKHPDAVHRVGRYKAVDYSKAMQLGMIPSRKAA